MLLQIAAVYAGVNIFILLVLAYMTSGARRRGKVTLGDGGDEAVLRAVRAHGNAAEYIPAGIAGITLLALLEPATSPLLLHIAGATLTAGRILHGAGLHAGTLNIGRMAGTALTWLSFLVIGGALIYFGVTARF